MTKCKVSGCTATANPRLLAQLDGRMKIVCTRCYEEMKSLKLANTAYRCQKCKKQSVRLYGLFIPHLCKACYDNRRKKQIEKKEVCSMCGKPYIDCYC